MDTFHVLAEPTRREIIEMLSRGGTLSAGEISNHFPSSSAAISQHLKILRDGKWVLVKKNAQQRLYTLNPKAILEVEVWTQRMRELWNQRFDRLENILVQQKKG